MQQDKVRTPRRITGALMRGILLLCLTLLAPAVPAQPRQVVVVGGDSAHHHAAFVAMRRTVEREDRAYQLIYRTVEEYRAAPEPQPTLLVAVGSTAAQALAAHAHAVPLLYVLLPRNEFAALPQNSGSIGALFVDQPLYRYLLLARIALPERTTVGAVLGPVSEELAEELHSAGRRLALEVNTASIGDSGELARALERVSRPAGVMVALPDPTVVNADTARTLIIDAYQRGVALIGYSQALAKAGALMAVHSTPEQLGQEAGEMVLAALATTPVRLPPPRYPSYFSVSVNYQVARALELDLPAEQRLAHALRQQELAR